MSKVNKIYEWDILGNYGYGWEILYTATSKNEASNILNDYRVNAPEGSYHLKIHRIKEATK